MLRPVPAAAAAAAAAATTATTTPATTTPAAAAADGGSLFVYAFTFISRGTRPMARRSKWMRYDPLSGLPFRGK